MGMTMTKFSGSLMNANSQQCIPANPLRKYLYIQNTDVNLSMYLGAGSAATATGIQIQPGGVAFIQEGDPCTTQEIFIIGPGALGGETYVAYEGV